MVAAQQPATCNRDEPGIQIARDAMSCSRRPRLPIRIASAPRWRPARRRIFEERRHIGAVTQTPERQTPHCGWWGVRGSSIVWVDSIPLPDPTGCQAGRRRFTQIPVIGSIPIAHHRNAGTYDRLCSPLQSCPSSRSPLSSEPAPRRVWADSGRADASAGGGTLHQTDHRPPIIGIRNSLQIPCSSLKIPC
jgi:hypothetical protein